MTHPVFDDPDIGTDVVLVHEDGTETPTRGRVAVAPERDSLREPGGLSVSSSTPATSSRVVRILVHGRTFQVVYAKRTAGALYSLLPSFDSTRYQCVAG